MEPMRSKMKGVANKSSFNGRSNNMNAEELEIRPGGMLVQKRDSNSNNQNYVPIPTIKVRVKYGSSSHHICISSQASFGELKKMLVEQTGIHHQDQKLIYKKKERDSKAFLDVAGVKDGSKIILIEDITSRERRCLEILKSAKIEKASKLLQQITLEVEKLREKVVTLERGEKVAELDIDSLIEILMNKLVALDGIVVDGDLKLQKGLQERRVQKYIETLDMLKLQNSKTKRNERSGITEIPVQQPENSNERIPIPVPIPMQKQPIQHKQKTATIQRPLKQHQQVLKHSDSFVITTKWETFD
ncbi:protein binding protein, putative [Ricinus communis]|uniref:Protein binding protein, putative n=2 Tax=Ricinus communis TaxID=3988 RepID=B9RC23_RICCO|nr:protein binding protein, putative [Ricinus communis]